MIHPTSYTLHPILQEAGLRVSASFILLFDKGFTLYPAKEALFALSLFPYLGFLWFITRSKQMPRLGLIGFYGTLVFVAVTIPAGIYAQAHYGKTLANVDWLHGGAEFFLTLTNILIVLGFRQAVKERMNAKL